MSRVSRRALLRMIGAAPAVAAAGCTSESSHEHAPSFFTDEERRALSALANVVIPPDGASPGGADLGAVAFIERLLGAFDVSPPALFADGPFSDRNPIPDVNGGSDGTRPPNDFARFRPIDRVTERAWRILIYGSKNVEGGLLNEGIVPPVVGLRDLLKDGLRAAMAAAHAPLETLPFDELRDVFDGLDRPVQNALIDLVVQASFGAPEYGGNPKLAGWVLVQWPGDVQPFGYSLYDARSDSLFEQRQRPLSSADPGPDPAPLGNDTRALLAQVVAFTDGKVFR